MILQIYIADSPLSLSKRSCVAKKKTLSKGGSPSLCFLAASDSPLICRSTVVEALVVLQRKNKNSVEGRQSFALFFGEGIWRSAVYPYLRSI